MTLLAVLLPLFRHDTGEIYRIRRVTVGVTRLNVNDDAARPGVRVVTSNWFYPHEDSTAACVRSVAARSETTAACRVRDVAVAVEQIADLFPRFLAIRVQVHRPEVRHVWDGS